MVTAGLVERVHSGERGFIGDRVDVWQRAVQVEMGDIERRNPRHHIMLKVDDNVIRYSGIERVHKVMVAEFRRGVHDRPDARSSERIGAGELIGQAFGQRRTEAVTQYQHIGAADRGPDSISEWHGRPTSERAVLHRQIDIGKTGFDAAGKLWSPLGNEHDIVDPLLGTISAADHRRIGIASSVYRKVPVPPDISSRTNHRLPEPRILRRYAVPGTGRRREDIVLPADDADDRPTICRDAGVQDIGCRILVQITHVPGIHDQQGVPSPVVLAQRAYADHWPWHGPSERDKNATAAVLKAAKRQVYFPTRDCNAAARAHWVSGEAANVRFPLSQLPLSPL